MDSTQTLIIGAGISGLAAAAALGSHPYLILEADDQIGGYCKTVKKDGFVWDYSGHFFHFKQPEIEAWLRARMPDQKVLTVEKKSFISYGGRLIDFPFQKNIHQLPQQEFIDCLYDLYFASVDRDVAPINESFHEMLRKRLGGAICDKFLVPYNEKVYACDLSTLDKDAMGRFFPHVDVADVIRNMKVPTNASYNSTFTYPEGGAIEYVKAIASDVRSDAICLNERVIAIDLERKVARTTKREIAFERIISSMPFNHLVAAAALPHDASVFSANKVVVFNFGFDKKGRSDAHWIYYPSRETVFYRIGYYDNIFATDRLSIYVEVGYPRNATPDLSELRARVLRDLHREGVISDHKLVAEHSVVLDPAYVHISRTSTREHAKLSAILKQRDVHSIGRYGGWTYCSIEDNIVEARALVAGWLA